MHFRTHNLTRDLSQNLKVFLANTETSTSLDQHPVVGFPLHPISDMTRRSSDAIRDNCLTSGSFELHRSRLSTKLLEFTSFCIKLLNKILPKYLIPILFCFFRHHLIYITLTSTTFLFILIIQSHCNGVV